MKFFLAAASTAFVVLLPLFADATTPFSITAPSTPSVTGYNVAPSASNSLGSFTFGLAGFVEGDGFTADYADCGSSGGGSVTGLTGTGLGQTFGLVNPSSPFATATWCIRATLKLPLGGTPTDLVALDYSVTVNVQADGTVTVDEVTQNVNLPGFVDAGDVAASVNGGSEIAYQPFTVTAQIDPNPIILGVTSSVDVSVFLTGSSAGYGCTVTGAVLSGTTTALTVVSDGGDQVGSTCGFDLDISEIPITAWTVDGFIQIDVTVYWFIARRALEDGSAQLELPESGSSVVEVSGELVIQKEGLSTAAIAGIAAAAGIIFFLVVFTMWRQGCFEDKRAAAKPPKTVCVDGENSHTTDDV